MAILKLLAILGTAILGIIGSFIEFKDSKGIIKKNGKLIFLGVVIFAVLTFIIDIIEGKRDNQQITSLIHSNTIISDQNDSIKNNVHRLDSVNKKLSNQLTDLKNENFKLSSQLTQTSLHLNNLLSGGNSFCYAKFLAYFSESGATLYRVKIFNDFDYPIYNLQLQLYDLDYVLDSCIEKINNIEFLNEDCYSTSRKVTDFQELPAKSSLTEIKYNLTDQNMSEKYFIWFNTRNGKYIEKIFVKKVNKKIVGIAYSVERDNIVVKEIFDGNINKNDVDFKNDYGFTEKQYPMMSKKL